MAKKRKHMWSKGSISGHNIVCVQVNTQLPVQHVKREIFFRQSLGVQFARLNVSTISNYSCPVYSRRNLITRRSRAGARPPLAEDSYWRFFLAKRYSLLHRKVDICLPTYVGLMAADEFINKYVCDLKTFMPTVYGPMPYRDCGRGW